MHSHDDELLVLAEALGEVKTKTEKLEAEFSTQARPLEAATNALSATLSGIKALQFHVIDNNLGALSARVEEMRKAVDEQVGVIALELKKADESNAAKAGQEADALRSEIAGLQAQLGTLGAQFEAQLARVEFAAKEEAKKLQLIPGPAGEAGASLNPRGTFIDGQTYNRLDVVSWLGSSYIATVDGVTEKPSKTSTQWQVLASRGNGGGGTASLNDMLGAPSAGTIVGSEGSSYVRKTLVAGANIAISETPSTITITGSEGQISLEDGSAAAPSLFFTNDPDTGIYRPGSNQLGISLGGSAQAVLTSTTFTVTPNLVVSGTGTSSIGGNATVAGTLTVSGGSVTLTGAAYPNFYSDGSSGGAFTIRKAGVAYGTIYGNETNTILDSAGSANLILQTGGATRGTFTSSGLTVNATTASTSTSTGALVVSGGLGVGGSLNAGAVFAANSITGGDTGLGTSIIQFKDGSGSTKINFKGNGEVTISATTASTSTLTGALVVSGGVGVAGTIYAGGTIRVVGSSHTLRFRRDDAIIDFSNTAENAYVTGTITGNTLQLKGNNGTGLTIGTTGNATFAGTLTVSAGSLVVDHVGSSSPTLSLSANGSVQSRFFANGSNTFLESYTNTPLILRTNQTTALTITTGQQVQVNATTASTSTSTGALVVSGGVGVAGAIYAGGKVVVNGGDAGAAQFAVASASGTLVANLTAGSTTNQSFGVRMFAGTSASDYGLFLRNVTDTTTLFKVDGVGGTTVGGSVTTAAPAGGTAAAWKLGTVASVSPTSPNRTIEVDIGGTIYYIHAKTTNN